MQDKNPRKVSNDKRIAAENELAQRLGYPTWRRLTTAAIKGDVMLGTIFSIQGPLKSGASRGYLCIVTKTTKKDDANG